MPVYQREQRLRELRELRARIAVEIAHLEAEIGAGRSGQPVRPARPLGRATTDLVGLDVPAATIRAWARANGYDVAVRGRVGALLREEYAAAQAQP